MHYATARPPQPTCGQLPELERRVRHLQALLRTLQAQLQQARCQPTPTHQIRCLQTAVALTIPQLQAAAIQLNQVRQA
jgi:hypothetical protein